MTRDELINTLSQHIRNEYNDAIMYVKLSKTAASHDLDGHAQILKDIAHEEFVHAQHLENILKAENKTEDNSELREKARAEVESV